MTETNAESQVESAPANEVAETGEQAGRSRTYIVPVVAIVVVGCVFLATIAACTGITITFLENAPW